MGKKGFIFVLIASMLVLCMPLSTLAAETVFQSDFAGGSMEKITSYINNPPAGGVEKPVFEIAQKDGVRQLVLDTSAYAGQPYPEKAVNNLSYQRVDIAQGTITDEMAEESEYFYEAEVKFEKTFSFFRFGARYGNAGWDAANPNAMRDENFLTVSNQGILRFGSWQKQLNLGESYKFGVLVNLQGETRTKELYLNDQLVPETAGSSVTLAGSATPKSNFKTFVTCYPSTSESTSPAYYVDASVILRSIKISKGNIYGNLPRINISGADEVLKPDPSAAAASAAYHASFDNMEPDEVLWSIDGEPAGAAVDAQGVLYLSGALTETTVSVRASAKSNPEVTAVKMISVAPNFFRDFQNETPGTMPQGWTNSTAAAVVQDGDNLYFDATPQEARFYRTFGEDGIFTFTWKGMVKSSAAKGNFMTIASSSDGYWYLALPYELAGGQVTVNSMYDAAGEMNTVPLGTFSPDTWIDAQIVLNLDQDIYSVYLNNVCVAKDFKMYVHKTGFKFSAIITRAAVDDLSVYSGTKLKDSKLVMRGPAQLPTPKAGADKSFQYSVEDLFGTAKAASWSVTPQGAGILIDQQGSLTLSYGVQPGSYVVSAQADGSVVEKSIVVQEVPYILEIKGRQQFILKKDTDIYTETYTCTDQFGDAEPVIWSITPETEGIRIDEAGTLTVNGTAQTGSYQITAQSQNNPALSAKRDIQISRVTYQIRGATQVMKPVSGSTSVKYQVFDNLNNECEAIWSVLSPVQGVTFTQPGVLKLGKNAPLGKIQIQAEVDGTPATLDVYATAGVFTDFEQDGVGAKPGKWEASTTNAKVAQEADQNKYLNANGSEQARYLMNPVITSGVVTIEWYGMMKSDNNANQNFLTISTASRPKGDGFDNGAWYLTLNPKKTDTGTFQIINNYGPSGTAPSEVMGEFPTDEWIHCRMSMNFDNQTYSIWMNETLLARDYIMEAGSQNFKIERIITNVAIDDLQVYHGEGTSQTLQVATKDAQYLIPQGEQLLRMPLEAEILEDGVPTGENADWKLEGQVKGVKVENGELVIDAAAGEGSFQLAAYIQGTKIKHLVTIGLFQPDARLSLAGNQLTISGDPQTVFQLRLYRPRKTQPLVEAFTDTFEKADYDALAEAGESTAAVVAEDKSITTDASGKAEYTIGDLPAGLYQIAVTKAGAQVSSTLYYGNKVGALFDTNAVANLENPKFQEVLGRFTRRSAADITKFHNSFLQTKDKNNVVRLINGDINLFYAACAAQSAMEQPNKEQSLLDALKLELAAVGVATDAVDVLADNLDYKAVTQAVLSTTYGSLKEFIGALYETGILKGVEKVGNKKDAKKFIARINNAKYNNATEEQKNTIASEVGGRFFNGIPALHVAINSVNLDGTSGGGGSGGNSRPSSSGSFGSEPTPTPTPSPTATPGEFADVSQAYWGYEPISALAKREILNGDGGYFRPEDAVTRAEFVKILCAGFGISGEAKQIFEDVAADAWYAPYVAAAYEAGLIQGNGSAFAPEEIISRQDAAVMAYRFAAANGIRFESGALEFNDAGQIAEYAKESVAAMSGSGILNGVGGGRFAPLDSTSRAAAAKMIYQVLKRGGVV